MRKLHINKEVWEYMIGKQNAVIKSPLSKKTIVPLITITGLSHDELFYEGKCIVEIKPSLIKSYIENNLK